MVLEPGIRFTLRDGIHTMSTGVITKVLPNLTEKEKEFMMLNRDKKQKLVEGKIVLDRGKIKAVQQNAS